MKSIFSFLILQVLLLTSISTNVQSQEIIWQKCLGGSNNDYAYSGLQTADGGYISAGFTFSYDGNVSGTHGGIDYWIQKLDTTGNLEWQKCLGGSGDEFGWTLQQSLDGNYVMTGTTRSNDGDVTGNHGYFDVWVVKLDTTGKLIWEKCLGGTGQDESYYISPTSDSGYIVTGCSASTDGMVTGNHGAFDVWIVKLNSLGNLEWQKSLGGTSDDFGHVGIQTKDGGYIFTGTTDSDDGDVTLNHGGKDLWVIKLDAEGNLDWQKCYGGSADDAGTAIRQTDDEGYIIGGYTLSNDGDVAGWHGNLDIWLLKLDKDGELTWQNCLGGSGEEMARSVMQMEDGTYFITGYTYSSDGDVTFKQGMCDMWLVKTRDDGELYWQKTYGGTLNEEGRSACVTNDGGFFISGYTFSDNGDVSGNHGSSDSWAIRLTGTLNQPVFTPPGSISVLPVTFTITAKPGSTIYYTTDGSTPDTNSILSGISPVTLTTPSPVGAYVYKAIAYESNWIASDVASSTYTIVPTGVSINPKDKSNELLVYPNPADKFIYVHETRLTEAAITLINEEGKIVLRSKLNSENQRLDISPFPEGTYILKIRGKETGSSGFTEKTTVVVFR